MSKVPLEPSKLFFGSPSFGTMVGSVPQKLCGKPCSNSWTASIFWICSAVSLMVSDLMLSWRCCGCVR